MFPFQSLLCSYSGYKYRRIQFVPASLLLSWEWSADLYESCLNFPNDQYSGLHVECTWEVTCLKAWSPVCDYFDTEDLLGGGNES